MVFSQVIVHREDIINFDPKKRNRYRLVLGYRSHKISRESGERNRYYLLSGYR